MLLPADNILNYTGKIIIFPCVRKSFGRDPLFEKRHHCEPIPKFLKIKFSNTQVFKEVTS